VPTPGRDTASWGIAVPRKRGLLFREIFLRVALFSLRGPGRMWRESDKPGSGGQAAPEGGKGHGDAGQGSSGKRTVARSPASPSSAARANKTGKEVNLSKRPPSSGRKAVKAKQVFWTPM